MPEIIAAIEANWLGEFSFAYQMFKKAKESGCDKVKMQFYTEEQVKDHPKFAKELVDSVLNYDKANVLMTYADEIGIELFFTPMYIDAVPILEQLGVKLYKIREKDSGNMDLINAVLDTGKPVYISARILPLDMLLLYHPQVDHLWVEPSYPMTDSGLRDLNYIDFQVWDGFSCHHPHIDAPILALARGAKAVEVHVTLDKNMPCPDQAVSLDFNELKRVCDFRNFIERISAS